jgi:hypothetical protein
LLIFFTVKTEKKFSGEWMKNSERSGWGHNTRNVVRINAYDPHLFEGMDRHTD